MRRRSSSKKQDPSASAFLEDVVFGDDPPEDHDLSYQDIRYDNDDGVLRVDDASSAEDASSRGAGQQHKGKHTTSGQNIGDDYFAEMGYTKSGDDPYGDHVSYQDVSYGDDPYVDHVSASPSVDHQRRAGVYTASIPIYHPGIIPLNQI